MSGPKYEPIDTGLQGSEAGVDRIQPDASREISKFSLVSRTQLLPSQGSYELNVMDGTQSRLPLFPPGKRKENLKNEPFLRRHNLTGYKFGLLTCVLTTSLILLLNLILTIWAASTHPPHNAQSSLYTGSCKEVSRLSTWIHLGINILSTLLLGASNYTMQVVSSPTRREVDRAHKVWKWLDIGIPSLGNLRWVGWGRILVWGVLVGSSVPLHLLYNTAVFSALSANAYNYIVIDENFLTPSANFKVATTTTSSTPIPSELLRTLHQKALKNTLTRHSSSSCMSLYASPFVSASNNVLLITSTQNNTNDILFHDAWEYGTTVPFFWLCGDGYKSSISENQPLCTLSIAQSHSQNWKVNDIPISYCLVENTPEKCSLQFSLSIMIVIILANTIKVFTMLWVYFKMGEETLVTVGDAAKSFLEEKDEMTKWLCVDSKRDFENGDWKLGGQGGGMIWEPRRHWWFRGASWMRWGFCNVGCLFAILFGGLLGFTQGAKALGNNWNLSTLYSLGLGSINAKLLLSIKDIGLFGAVFVANLPQIIISFLYLSYNGLYTCLLAEHEWNKFARERGTLRVTSPKGMQRSTYFLSLPYHYAVPLIILSALLHWLVSQSLFLAYINIYSAEGLLIPTISRPKVGYSLIGLFFTMLIGAIAVIAAFFNVFRKYDSGIPLMGSCSAAISAACHRPDADVNAVKLPLMWGVVNEVGEGEVGHCCLTSFEVREPVLGRAYAGLKGGGS